jgi:hypothetical protein
MTMFSLPRFAVGLLVIAVVITFSVFRSGRATAASTSGVQCGALGTYGFTGFGNTFAGNPLGFDAGVVSSNGIITLGPDGKWFVREFEVVNGVVAHSGSPAEYTGDYTVNADCTATLSLGGAPSLVGVIVDHGKQLRAMSIIPGVQVNYVSTAKIEP